MLHEVNGDLLKSDCTVIMHQANCFKIMGAGIAKNIAELYPEVKNVDLREQGNPIDRFGRFTKAIINRNLTIVNLYGQYNIGRGLQTNYEKLESSIDKFLLDARLNNNVSLSKVGVPYKLGCGLAGGDWKIVKDILSRQSNKHEVDIYIYKL